MPPYTTKRRTTTFKNKKQPELTENRTVWKSKSEGDKEETFIQTGRRGGDRQPGRTRGREVAGRSREVADCGAGWAKLQLASESAAGGLGDRPCNPWFQRGEIKPQISE